MSNFDWGCGPRTCCSSSPPHVFFQSCLEYMDWAGDCYSHPSIIKPQQTASASVRRVSTSGATSRKTFTEFIFDDSVERKSDRAGSEPPLTFKISYCYWNRRDELQPTLENDEREGGGADARRPQEPCRRDEGNGSPEKHVFRTDQAGSFRNE